MSLSLIGLHYFSVTNSEALLLMSVVWLTYGARFMRYWSRTATRAPSSPGTLMWWNMMWCSVSTGNINYDWLTHLTLSSHWWTYLILTSDWSTGQERLSKARASHPQLLPLETLAPSTWDQQPSLNTTLALAGGGRREKITSELRCL